MPNYNDYYQKELNARNAVVATGVSAVLSLNKNNGGGAAINASAVPIQTCRVFSRATVADVVATILLEGSFDGTNWFSLGAITVPTLAASKTDVFTNVCAMYVRVNVSAYTSGTYTADVLLMGNPS